VWVDVRDFVQFLHAKSRRRSWNKTQISVTQPLSNSHMTCNSKLSNRWSLCLEKMRRSIKNGLLYLISELRRNCAERKVGRLVIFRYVQRASKLAGISEYRPGRIGTTVTSSRQTRKCFARKADAVLQHYVDTLHFLKQFFQQLQHRESHGHMSNVFGTHVLILCSRTR
jgi:hypothetical protein